MLHAQPNFDPQQTPRRATSISRWKLEAFHREPIRALCLKRGVLVTGNPGLFPARAKHCYLEERKLSLVPALTGWTQRPCGLAFELAASDCLRNDLPETARSASGPETSCTCGPQRRWITRTAFIPVQDEAAGIAGEQSVPHRQTFLQRPAIGARGNSSGRRHPLSPQRNHATPACTRAAGAGKIKMAGYGHATGPYTARSPDLDRRLLAHLTKISLARHGLSCCRRSFTRSASKLSAERPSNKVVPSQERRTFCLYGVSPSRLAKVSSRPSWAWIFSKPLVGTTRVSKRSTDPATGLVCGSP